MIWLLPYPPHPGGSFLTFSIFLCIASPAYWWETEKGIGCWPPSPFSNVSLRPHAIAVLNCVERLSWPLKQRRQLVRVTLHGMFTAVRVNCLNPSHSNRVWDRTLSTYYNCLSHPPTLGVSNKQSYTDPGWTGHSKDIADSPYRPFLHPVVPPSKYHDYTSHSVC